MLRFFIYALDNIKSIRIEEGQWNRDNLQGWFSFIVALCDFSAFFASIAPTIPTVQVCDATGDAIKYPGPPPHKYFNPKELCIN
jgi:hypothetical protein